MKVFIIFTTAIAIAHANAVGRAGWGAPPTKPVPSIDLELAAVAAAAAAGQASAGQALLETAAGTIDAAAYISNLNGVQSQVAQEEDISQVQIVHKPSGATSTINAVDAINIAEASDLVEADIGGGLAAGIGNSAHTLASGDGAIAAEESSLNTVQHK